MKDCKVKPVSYISFHAEWIGGISCEEDNPVCQQDSKRDKKCKSRLTVINNERSKKIAERDPLENAEYAYACFWVGRIYPIPEYQVIPAPFKKRPPLQEQTDSEDQDRTENNFFQKNLVTGFAQAGHDKRECITDCKQEERKNKIGGCEAMPGRVIQGRKNMTPVAGIIYEDHQADGGPAKDVQGVVSVVQGV